MQDICTKFFEHFISITASITGWSRARTTEGPTSCAGKDACGHKGLWSEEDGFFYDVAHFDDGTPARFVDVKSFVGMIPMFAVLAISEDDLEKLPSFRYG